MRVGRLLSLVSFAVAIVAAVGCGSDDADLASNMPSQGTSGESGSESASASGSAVSGPSATTTGPDWPATATVAAHEPGPFAVGHSTFSFSREASDTDELRTFRVEVWYPAGAAGGTTPESTPEADQGSTPEAGLGSSTGADQGSAPEAGLGSAPEADQGTVLGTPLVAMEQDPSRADALATLLADAPEGCLRTRTGALRDAPEAAPRDAPLLVYSHCHVCTRWSGSAIAERLASHGFVVLAPDHEGNTLWDELEGEAARVGAPFLRVRADDLHALIAALRGGPGADALPSPARRPSPQIGVVGHSFGAATAALVAQEDAAIAAAFAIAAPMASRLLPGVNITDIGERPLGFLLAVEDNSITTFGNTFLRNNFEAALGARLLAEVADLGHWGMSDVVALLPDFSAGCGEDRRMTNTRETFTYLAPDRARELAAGVVTAFFVEAFAGEEAAASALDALDGAEELTLSR